MFKIQLVYRMHTLTTDPARSSPVVRVITLPEVALRDLGVNLTELLDSVGLTHIPAAEIVSLTIIGE